MLSKKSNCNCPKCGASSEKLLVRKLFGFIPIKGLNIPGIGWINEFNYFDKIPVSISGRLIKQEAQGAISKTSLGQLTKSELLGAVSLIPDNLLSYSNPDIGDFQLCLGCGFSRFTVQLPEIGAGQ